jgi:hypothetical protein
MQIKTRFALVLLTLVCLPTAGCRGNPAIEQLDSLTPEDLLLSGLYDVCDPQGRSFKLESGPSSRLADVLDEGTVTVEAVLFSPGWDTPEAAGQDILAFLSNPDEEASPTPIFALDFPLDLVAKLTYADGSEGVFAASLGKVCLTDRKGRAWYLQWAERFPSP